MNSKKLKKYLNNPPVDTVHGVKLINFSKIIEETMNDPKREKNIEMEMKKLELSLAIINLRKKKKISQAKLAKEIGMKQSAVGRIEAGKQNLTIETLQKIAFAFNKELVVSFR